MLNCSFLQSVGEFLIHQTNGHAGRKHGGPSDGVGPFPPARNMAPALRSHQESSGDPLSLREQMCFHKQKWTPLQKICRFSSSPSQPPGDNCAVYTHSSAGVQGPWGMGEAGYRKGAWGSQKILCVSCLHGFALNVASEPVTPMLSRFPARPNSPRQNPHSVEGVPLQPSDSQNPAARHVTQVLQSSDHTVSFFLVLHCRL